MAAFSKSNLNTIETIDPNYQNTIGQRSRLSFSDVKKINAAYCSDVCAEKLTCKFGGYTDPKNCSRCRCTDGLSTPLCADPTRTSRDCGQLKRQATARFQELSTSGSGECNYLITAPSRRAQILIEFVGA
ncbi:unnamed protein product, partial [Anisakis simplex]|uniref:Astacin domain-containing protein n=1 Tax=Anisakis simplex TaxID=6269 RepID=A0A0M3JIK5_ANISI